MLASWLLAVTALPAVSAQTFSLIDNYEGINFFSGFKYNISVDNTTWGNVNYVGSEKNLTYINTAGNAIIKVDNRTQGPVGDRSWNRDSLKLVSRAGYDLGTLFVIDAVHVPYGCGLWPAIWTLSRDWTTDDGGEADIFETVNLDLANQYTLHTRNGCRQSNSTSMPFTGQVVSTNCYYGNMGNQGCQFREKKPASAGSAFAQGGGGVFVMLYDVNGIQSWFFPRNAIPADIGSRTPNPATWGAPTASWPSSTCDMHEYFTPQNIIINISLCGQWAGKQDVYQSTCSGICTDRIANPANFDQAYFELASIRTYTNSPNSSGGTHNGINSNANGNGPAKSATSILKAPATSNLLFSFGLAALICFASAHVT